MRAMLFELEKKPVNQRRAYYRIKYLVKYSDTDIEEKRYYNSSDNCTLDIMSPNLITDYVNICFEHF